jgi:hypothetical protein
MEVGLGKNKYFAYKAIVSEEGVIFLFQSFDRKGLKYTPEINYYQEDIYLEYGDNVIVFTQNICSQLIKTPKLIFVVSSPEYYEALEYIGSLDVDPHIIAKIQGAIQVFNNNGSSAEFVGKFNWGAGKPSPLWKTINPFPTAYSPREVSHRQ